MEIGTFGRASFLGCPLVQIRCAPHTMCGTIGTWAAIAMRAAPDLNSLISKLRLIVASGYTPTSSPARSAWTACSNEAAPLSRSTSMWRRLRMIGPVILWSNTSFFAMNRTLRPRPCR